MAYSYVLKIYAIYLKTYALIIRSFQTDVLMTLAISAYIIEAQEIWLHKSEELGCPYSGQLTCKSQLVLGNRVCGH